MRNKRRTDEEWLSLIQECRSSGFSDRVWCEQNDISFNTFYNMIISQAEKDPVHRTYWRDFMDWYSVTDTRVITSWKMSYWYAVLHMQDGSSSRQSRQPGVKG